MESPWKTKLLSLLMAILLFFYVSYENGSKFQSNNQSSVASVVSSEVLTDIPIEVNVNTDKYFVSGIPDGATIRLEGPQAILFQTTVTQNFKITTPNLNELGVGTHQITLEASGLSNEIHYSISPAEITVTVEEKEQREFSVEVEVSSKLDLAEGYSMGEPEIQEKTVVITGAPSTLNKIDKVKAIVESDIKAITQDITVLANLVVLDAQGNPLNVNVSVPQVNVRIPVSETKKTVPIVLRMHGQQAGYKYKLALSENESKNITVIGDTDAIKEIANYPINVNVEGITETQVIDVSLDQLPEGIKEVNRDVVKVLVTVTNSSGESTSETSSSSQSRRNENE